MKLEFDEDGIIGRYKSTLDLSNGRDFLFNKIKNTLNKRVIEAWIFGSFARKEETNKSDLDLILVTDTTKKFHHRIEDFEDLFSTISEDLDILIYTKEEFKSGLESTQGGFWREFKRDGVRLI